MSWFDPSFLAGWCGCLLWLWVSRKISTYRAAQKPPVENAAEKQLRAERDELADKLFVAQEAGLKASFERDEAQKNYQFMVDRAADEKLDGYRELGRRAAEAENALGQVRRERDELKLKYDAAIELHVRVQNAISNSALSEDAPQTEP